MSRNAKSLIREKKKCFSGVWGHVPICGAAIKKFSVFGEKRKLFFIKIRTDLPKKRSGAEWSVLRIRSQDAKTDIG